MDGKVCPRLVLPSGTRRKLGSIVFTRVGLFRLLAVFWLCWNSSHYGKELHTLLFENYEEGKVRSGLSWNEASFPVHLDIISFKLGGDDLQMRS
jgi:hypothetical protein